MAELIISEAMAPPQVPITQLLSPQPPAAPLSELLGNTEQPQGPQSLDITARLPELRSEVAANKDLLAKRAEKLKGTREKLLEAIRARGGIQPTPVEAARVNREQLLTGAVYAAVAGALGARNAGQAFTQYSQGLQQQADLQTQERVLASQQAYQTQMQQADTEISLMKYLSEAEQQDLADIAQRIARGEGSIADIEKLSFTQEQLNTRAREAQASREAIAKINDDTKRFVATLNQDYKLNKPAYEIASEYKGYRDLGFTDEEAKSMVTADARLVEARVGLTEAQTRTEEMKPAEIQARIDQGWERLKIQRFSSETARMNAERNWQKWTEKANTEREVDNIGIAIAETDVEIADRQFYLKEAEEWLREAEALEKEYQAIIKDRGASSAEVKEAEAALTRQKEATKMYRDLVRTHKQRIHAMKKEQGKRKVDKKRGAPGSGAAPFDPVGTAGASLRGRI